MYQLVIFDLDGTLLNTIDDLSNASNEALRHFGYKTHSVEECKHMVGNGIYKLVERSLPQGERDRENVLRVKAVFDDYYAIHSQDMTRPYPGIVSLLDTLNELGVKCGVVTNKAHDYACELMQHYFGDRLQLVIGQREGIPTKPDPYSVLEMMKHFQAEPEACLYVGDSNVDIETAQAAGLASAGVLWGFRGEKELTEAGASYLAADAEDLLTIIKNEGR